MARKQTVIFTVLAIVMLVLLSGCGWWTWAIQSKDMKGTSEVLTVEPGMNTRQIAAMLEEHKIIRSALVFRYLAKAEKADEKIIHGMYLFSPAQSPIEILNELINGPDVEILRVTFPEGYNTDQIVTALVEKGLGTKEDFYHVIANDVFDYAFLQGTPSGIHRLDGFLFPDTYYFEKNNSPHEIIEKILQRFGQEITSDTATQLQQVGLTLYEWVTLSSLVEKEAVKAEDRQLIASVFLNRLAKNMKLESCATIQYILGTPKAKLYEKDLQIPSPYNTYLHAGLPPGPIASPGHASLDAVLHPAKTDYLFFVAKSNGYHVFSKTYEEHLQNQKKYQ